MDIVTNTNDSGAGSLRAVIADASNLDTINFAPNIMNTTITLTSGVIQTNLDLTIAAVSGQNITISGGDNSQIFNFTDPDAVCNETINNLIFTGGKNVGRAGFGGAIFDQGTLALTGDQFNGNQAGYGGAVFAPNFGATPDYVTITNTQFRSNNATTGNGGAIYVGGHNVTLNNSSFTSNTSNLSGGAVEASGSAGAGTTLTVNAGCVFNSNSVTGSGDRTNYYGGAINTIDILTVQGSSTIAVSFINNSAVDGGGAINYEPVSAANSSMTLINSTFTSNTGESGGAEYSNVNTRQGTVTINVSGSTFNNNEATGPDSQYIDGGGIFLNQVTSGTGSAQATITNNTFYQNTSEENGGGLAVQLNNSGTGLNTVSLTSLTVYQNSAATQGGGLWVDLTGTGTSAATVHLHNSIVAGNCIDNAPSDGSDVFFTILGSSSALQFKSQGYNFIGIGDGGVTWVGSDEVGSSSNPFIPSLDLDLPRKGGHPVKSVDSLLGGPSWRESGAPTPPSSRPKQSELRHRAGLLRRRGRPRAGGPRNPPPLVQAGPRSPGRPGLPRPRQAPPFEEELRRLRAENQRLRAERDILKKATALFAREAL